MPLVGTFEGIQLDFPSLLLAVLYGGTVGNMWNKDWGSVRPEEVAGARGAAREALLLIVESISCDW